jgi:transposase
MAYKYIGKDIYKQLEQVMNRLDETLSINKELIETIKNLNKTISELREENKKLLNEIDRLKNQNNKNSTNSSKPSSTNITTPKKKTGANLYNYRIKTDKKIGGQLGHTGYNLNKKKVEELIKDKKVEVIEIKHKIKGNSKLDNVVKYKLGINIKPYVEKHVFIYNEDVNESLPKEFYTDVTYTNDIKTLSLELGTYNLISYDRLSDFFSVITNNVINISNGTLVNFLYDFSSKSKLTINNLENNILNNKINYTDETTAKFNKKNLFVRNYSNEETVIYKVHKNKGHNPILEDNILPRFCGGIMGDHDTTLYSYGTERYECNIHIGRYLEELIQNISEISWPVKMKELLFRMHNTRKMAIQYGVTKFNKEKIEEYEREYDEILELAKKENKEIKSSYYKDKANKLYRRLKKYKKNHLYFIKDFSVPFDNNLSESDLRCFKNKTKISGGFRTMKGAISYVNALTIIKTSIKRNINPFESITAIFNNKVLFQD